jgi:NADH-quinone oxidoreductase subunit L
MTAGLAVGGYQPALFHLLNHAAFKALLFLAAGSVLHALGTNLMSEMGGLWRRMPLTFVTFLVGALALTGVPPFSGAFSKDAILDAARRVASGDHAATGVSSWLGVTVYAAGLVTVVLTALYTTRMVARTFLGPRHDDAALDDSSRAMSVPLVILAVPAAGLGVLALHRFLPSWLPSPVAGTFGIELAWGPLLVTLALVAVSVGAVLLLVRAKPDRDPALLLAAPLRVAFAAGLGVDAAYRSFVVRPVMAAAHGLLVIDSDFVDGTVNATGRTARWAGGVVKLSQSGNVQAYATMMLLGAVVIAIVVAVP